MTGTPGVCLGVGSDHCCYVSGLPCPHLEDGTVPGRRWACGLRRELGSWDLVHADARYAPIQAEWDRVGIESCGAYPEPGRPCPVCEAG